RRGVACRSASGADPRRRCGAVRRRSPLHLTTGAPVGRGEAMNECRRLQARLALVFGFILIPVITDAQTSLQIPLQFDFLNPGAKSLALAGSFAGLADDATATFANPAGLTQLAVSEFSAELRASRTSTQFLEAGRLSGVPSNEKTDTIAGAVFGTSTG